MAVRRKFVRKIALDLLARHNVTSAPVPVEQIARRMGAEVRRQATDDDLSGFLLRDAQHGRVIIGVNSAHSETRRRFTVAHELGHFLLPEGEQVHVDRTEQLYRVKLRDDVASKGIDLDEREANLFAAELLMPAAFIEDDLARMGRLDPEDEASMSSFARRYKVSVQALTFRLANLGYISLD